ncbi:2-oxoglutarate dehydrogenase [uncultured Mediterranean phage uvMED]|nr:2-oxoglutarate dehydrogenase [uncultured Mediterranean phage uvMED]
MPTRRLLGAQPASPPVVAAASPTASMAMPMPKPPRPAAPAPAVYDDAIMRNARGIGLPPTGLLGQTPAAPAAQQQKGLFGDFLGTSFDDPRTRRNLAGAAALLEAGGPQMRPVGTGQAVGMAINAMLGQQSEIDKLNKVSAKGFEARGPVVREGTNDYLGEAVFNPTTGQMMLSTPSGKLISMPADAEPSVKSVFSRDIMGASGVRKMFADVDEHEISLFKLQNYMESQEGRQFGYKGIADKFVADIKSFLASDDPDLKLTPAQLSQKLSASQLQGLLGASRLDVVGGGVMTEQDALRVLSALGGDINAMQNPEVVAARIKEIYETRYKRYETDLGILNRQLSAQGVAARNQIPNFFVMPSGTVSSSAGDVGYEIVE